MKVRHNVRDYFDLNKSVPFGRQVPDSAQQLSVPWQIATYIIVVIAIVASRFLDLYRTGTLANFHPDLPYVLSLAIVSLAIFPFVYNNARFNRGQPILLQVGVVFSTGMGWEKIIATVINK